MLEDDITIFGIEFDIKKLQDIAVAVDKIFREEISKARLKCSFAEARVYNIRAVGVQGDARTYGHPAEITLIGAKHFDGRDYNDEELYDFLGKLSSRITNEIKDVNRVVYLTKTKDDKI